MIKILFFIESLSGGGADKAAVIKAIEKYGFDSKIFARRLCKMYEDAVKEE